MLIGTFSGLTTYELSLL